MLNASLHTEHSLSPLSLVELHAREHVYATGMRGGKELTTNRIGKVGVWKERGVGMKLGSYIPGIRA
jgi:hypothetical protein